MQLYGEDAFKVSFSQHCNSMVKKNPSNNWYEAPLPSSVHSGCLSVFGDLI